MNRLQFRKQFKVLGPAVLPVIHVQDTPQTLQNIQTAVSEGAQGVFLINHDFGVDEFLPIVQEVRSSFPALWLGINFLGVTGRDAFPVLGKLQGDGYDIDAYWADDARIDESENLQGQVEADEILRVKKESGWRGLYFGGTAFKKQREVSSADFSKAASLAAERMDVVTTSGVATGKQAELSKIRLFREAMDDRPLAVASGITPNNVGDYADDVDAVLVATGINCCGDFYNIDKLKLRALIHNCRRSAVSEEVRFIEQDDRDNRWYLSKMAPRARGEKYAWLDPSSAYINASSFHAMLDDLLAPFSPDEVDVVAGFDAAGFVLGAAMADRLGKGFLTIRKGGKIPVEFDVVDMSNYSGQTQQMEMRKPAFAPGTRVLLVDQWIETGGTMSAGISLVERQGGEIAGIAAVCIEDTEASHEMRRKYKLSSCVVPGSAIQDQCDRQSLDSFATFRPEDCFPEIGNKS